MSGHGISDAVRNSVSTWFTDKVIEILWKEGKSSGLIKDDNILPTYSFKYRIRNSSEWFRISRTKSDKAGIWKRVYYSKLFGRGHVGLVILTNKKTKDRTEDMYIEYITITLGNKVIGGGKVQIPSVSLSQTGRITNILDFESPSLFSEFTEAELAKLSDELEFSEEGVYVLLEDERII